MTLMTLSSSTAVTTAQCHRRLYAEQIPGWQRFQSPLLVNNATTATATATATSTSTTAQQFPYLKQYSHVYYQRLMMLSPLIWNRIRTDISTNSSTTNIQHTSRILELPEDTLSSCVGTLIMERNDNSNIIMSSVKEEEDDADILLLSRNNNATQCFYYLEDESGRVALNLSSYWNNNSNNNNSMTDLCNGVVIGVIGIVGMDGIMQVQQICTAASVQTISPSKASSLLLLPSLPLETVQQQQQQRQPYILLLSGLDCGRPTSDSIIARDMLLSYLQGTYSAMQDKQCKAKSIVHVVVAGGLIYNNKDSTNTSSKKKDEKDVIMETEATRDGCYDLDIFCYHITQIVGIPISILPGQYDPTTANWPQRPIHTSLLPNTSTSSGVGVSSSSSTIALLNRCPNPYIAKFNIDHGNNSNKNDQSSPIPSPPHNTTTVMGTDGRNIMDWVEQTKRNRGSNTDETNTRNSSSSSNYTELQALQATITHQHLCPTGPDTVPTAPQNDIDSMVMPSVTTTTPSSSSSPIIYFAGNCTKFQTKLVSVETLPTNDTAASTNTQTAAVSNVARLICIPKFSETYTAVLVNMVTLQVELIQFTTSSVIQNTTDLK